MRCQWNMYGEDACHNEATQVADVPIVGDSICFCDDHVAQSSNSKWYPLTPERAAEEEKAEKDTWEAIRQISKMRFTRKDD